MFEITEGERIAAYAPVIANDGSDTLRVFIANKSGQYRTIDIKDHLFLERNSALIEHYRNCSVALNYIVQKSIYQFDAVPEMERLIAALGIENGTRVYNEMCWQ